MSTGKSDVKWWAAGVVGAAIVLAGGAARADQVVLKNGDKLDGHIVNLLDGKMTVNVLGLGDVKVDATQIATFRTDAPVDLRLSDGTAAKLALAEVPAGGVVAQGSLIPGRPVAIADVTQINPPEPAWTGSISAGALLIRGNSDTDSLNLGVNLAHKTDQDTFGITAAYLYGRTKDRTTGVVTTTTENWQAEGRYDYNFTKRTYGFLDVQFRKDRIAELDLRFIPSGGVGYKFFDEADFKLAGEVGVAWVYERYTNATPTKEDVSARAAYHVTKKFNDVLSAFNDAEYLQSVERGRNFIVNADLGVHVQVSKHLFGEAKITLDYDATPANGALKNDVFYALSVGYNL